MNGWTFSRIVGKYKKCPTCGSTCEGEDFNCSLQNDIITISCKKCGYIKQVDDRNKEVNNNE